MPSVPLAVDSSLENNDNIDRRRRGNGDSSQPVSDAAVAASRPRDGQQHHHDEHHQHNNSISDLSDDNNCSDEDQRREAVGVITPMRSPPSVKTAVATALEAEQLMERRRTSEGKKATTETEETIDCKKSNIDSPGDKTPSSSRSRIRSRSRSRSSRKNVSPAVPKAGMAREYVGVTYSRTRNQWQARVCILQKQQYCGRYRLAADAARAYDDTIKKLGLPREANFSSEEEYLRARGEEILKHESEAQSQRDRLDVARAAAGLGNALPSYAPAPNVNIALGRSSSTAAISSHATSGTKRELEVDFIEAETPPPSAAKKARNDLKAHTDKIKDSDMDKAALPDIVAATEQRMKPK